MKRIIATFILTGLAIFGFSTGSISWASAPGSLGCELSPDRSVLPANRTERAVLKVRLEAPKLVSRADRPPVNLAIVLDRSGSMSGSKIQKAREGAIAALRMLNGGDVFSLIAYDHEIDTIVPAQSAGYTEGIEQKINRLEARGNTALFGGVSQGASEVRKNLRRDFVHRLILLSDGIANVGPSSPTELGRLGAALLKEGISVSTMGVGTDFNEDLMTQLAEESDGNHYFVESSVDLPRIFAAELGDVLNIAARKISIEVTVKGGRPIRIIGREGRIAGNRAEIYLNQVYGGQEKYALIEIEVPPTDSGADVELASAKCSYEDAVTNKAETRTALTRVRFSSREGEVAKSANKAVLEDVVNNEMAVARDRALDLYNMGQKEDAARELRAKSKMLQSRSEVLGFSDLAAEAAGLEKDAVEFEQEKLTSPKKKSLRSDSYRTRNQQKVY